MITLQRKIEEEILPALRDSMIWLDLITVAEPDKSDPISPKITNLIHVLGGLGMKLRSIINTGTCTVYLITGYPT